MNRRELLLSIGAGTLALAASELILPSRKIFLPPKGGWPNDYMRAWRERTSRGYTVTYIDGAESFLMNDMGVVASSVWGPRLKVGDMLEFV